MAIDIYGFLNMACAVVGAIIFVACIVIVRQIIALFPGAKMTGKWRTIQVLIGFFLMGYVMNILAVVLAWTEVLLLMQAFVYVFGAVFVFMVVSLAKQTYTLILEAARDE